MSVETTKSVTVNSTPWLFVLFVILFLLKVTGTTEVAEWSWWWVTAPLWLPWAIFLGILIVIGIIALPVLLVASVLDKRDAKRRRQRLQRGSGGRNFRSLR